MSQHSESKPELKLKPVNLPSDSIMIIRLAIAVVIFAVTLIVNMTSLVTLLLRFVAVAVAGYDICFKILDEVEKKNYFSESMIIVFVTVISFAIGCSGEGTALVILYRIVKLAEEYVINRTKKSALELVEFKDSNVVDKVKSIINDDEAVKTDFADTIKSSSDLILKAIIGIAVIYAILLPIVTNYSFFVSIHRALMMIIVATPASMIINVPLTAIVSICFGAQKGIIFKNASVIEKAAEIETVVFDKTGIFTEGTPRLLSAQSDILPADTFMTFAAHSVYYSDQEIAKAIAANFNRDYQLEVISNFSDIPGLGVELDIANNHIVFAKADVFNERGIDIPLDEDSFGQTYYMVYGDRYVGKVVLSNDFNEDSSDLCNVMRNNGINKCVLLTEDSRTESEEAATNLDFDAFYSECNPIKKKEIVEDICDRSNTGVMYVYASGIESHSAASVDVRVARKGKYADILILPESLDEVPSSVSISKRFLEIAKENAVFAFVIKALVVFLAINGVCTLWFAMFIDFAAAIATILNSIRVTTPSLLSKLNIDFKRPK